MRKRGRMGLETRERRMAAKVAGRAAVRRRERTEIEKECERERERERRREGGTELVRRKGKSEIVAE